jgi:copper chaperone CopZ
MTCNGCRSKVQDLLSRAEGVKHVEVDLARGGWIATYKPILLIFLYITVISLIAATAGGGFSLMTAMRIWMGGFFLTFSFFKMLDIPAFAESYAMYDIVAKRFEVWGYLYVFIEALLGICYALNFQPLFTAVVTVVVMTMSLLGVLNSVLAKRKIKCACLGAVFNLPMSSVTIIEDGLMISMGIAMILVGKML